MEKIIHSHIKSFWQNDKAMLYHADSMWFLPKIEKESIDMVFADPPYFLSDGGISCSGGKQVSVDKGKWDSAISLKEKHLFNRRWIRLCSKLLKPDGTIWVSGTMHNIYSVGMALEQEGFRILNNITWEKTNPPPNLACRCFTHSTETILWACKNNKYSKHLFNYELMKELNGNKQMKDVWKGSLTPPKEKKSGKHPTQKPEYLLERIILSSTKRGDLILDPFTGSSTTGVVALKNGRKFIGIDMETDFLEISRKRLSSLTSDERSI